MEALSAQYKDHLEQLKAALIHSDLLQNYLDTEDEADFKLIAEGFEPHIQELYELVANKHPLQLVALERELLDPAFEGMFLPRILGYSVLRGEIDANYKYKRPQDHFKDILLSICESANYEVIKNRIGQTVQIGFALSSDIWLSNLIEQVSNKKIKSFLLNQKQDKFRDLEFRKVGYENYAKQFGSQNFQSCEFPKTLAELKIYGSSLKTFLLYRAHKKFDNTSLIVHLSTLLKNESLYGDDDFLEIMMITGMFYEISSEDKKLFSGVFDKLRSTMNLLTEKYFKLLLKLYRSDVEISPDTDKRMSALISKTVKDEITSYYKLMDIIHTKGYVHEDSIEAAKNYYDLHKGISPENECLREGIFGYCEAFLNNLDTDSYHEYFEINKIFVSYINVFYNQKFNQNIKDLSLRYINRLLETYTDKRGKDYQDIKKFVNTTFLDLGFKSEKELNEIFKTKK
ncbi:MAG: hypothetical protein IPM42_20155 [Saprospiraceae bacterium]|nr:hypothetical protein [Saprospiraceae bacterium]